MRRKLIGLLLLVVSGLWISALPATAGDVTADNLRVFEDADVHGKLVVTASPEVTTNSLELWYSFSTNATPVADDSGNGNTGTVYTATWTSSGKIDGAYQLDGTNDYIRVSTMTNQLSGDFTLAAWVYCTGSGGDVFDSYVTSYGNYWVSLIFDTVNNRMNLNLYDGSQCPYIVSANSSVTTGVWYHVVGTRNTTDDKIYLYIDGDEKSSTTDTTTTVPSYGNLDLGACNGGGGATRMFQGLIDEPRVYDRALSDTEILELYLNGRETSDGDGTAEFRDGVIYLAPLGDLSMGTYTNAP